MNDERGVIRQRNYATQVRNFSGLRFGNITPTDIDGLIEYHDKGFLLIELKYKDSELPFGQRLAIERLVDALQKPAVAIIASHESAPGQDIDVAAAIVREYRSAKKWHMRVGLETVRQFADRWLGWLEKRQS